VERTIAWLGNFRRLAVRFYNQWGTDKQWMEG
jgi:transposase